MKEIKFNLGCGDKKLNGYYNLDIDDLDLNNEQELAAFSNLHTRRVSEILLDNVLEHLTIHPHTLFAYLIKTLRFEPERGKLIIITPNFFNWKHRLKYLFGHFIWTDGYHPFHCKLVKGSTIALFLRWLGMNIERIPNDLFDQDIRIVARIKA